MSVQETGILTEQERLEQMNEQVQKLKDSVDENRRLQDENQQRLQQLAEKLQETSNEMIKKAYQTEQDRPGMRNPQLQSRSAAYAPPGSPAQKSSAIRA